MKSVHKLISEELSKGIEDMQKKIQDFFGLDISYIDASKIVSWKSKRYNAQITSDKLIEILGGKCAKSFKVKK